MVINDLLKKLEDHANPDDGALVVKGKFLSTIYELTQWYLSIVANWADGCCLAMNPNKIEMVSFKY